MKIRLTLFLLLTTLVFVGCQTTQPRAPLQPNEKRHTGATFELSYPQSITAVVDQGDGYAVHYFRLGESKSVMGIYEGLRPQLFAKKEKDLTVLRRGKTSRGNIERGDDAWGIDSDGKIWRESVWNCIRTAHDQKGKSIQLPTTIHIWYFGATEQEQDLFDSIVNTLEMKE
jgi:hypothetical protein